MRMIVHSRTVGTFVDHAREPIRKTDDRIAHWETVGVIDPDSWGLLLSIVLGAAYQHPVTDPVTPVPFYGL